MVTNNEASLITVGGTLAKDLVKACQNGQLIEINNHKYLVVSTECFPLQDERCSVQLKRLQSYE